MLTPGEFIERSRADKAAAGPTAILNNRLMLWKVIGWSPRKWLILHNVIAAPSRPTPGKTLGGSIHGHGDRDH